MARRTIEEKYAYRREWGKRNKLKLKEYMRQWAGYPEPTRPQPDFCDCCGGPPNGKGDGFHLDHCHETNQFRGWLCSNCNSGIGKLGDCEVGVQMALEYLRRANIRN